ncbi:hypothetical protein V2G26_015379 [Clonostachys chloroleuca]
MGQNGRQVRGIPRLLSVCAATTSRAGACSVQLLDIRVVLGCWAELTIAHLTHCATIHPPPIAKYLSVRPQEAWFLGSSLRRRNGDRVDGTQGTQSLPPLAARRWATPRREQGWPPP